jgi:(S)-ureidoglycine aminohydrolase
MQTSRGVRGASFTLVTPANHYPSRLPVFGDAPVVKLVTPRLVPSRIGQYLVTLAPGGGGAKRVDPGHEVFFYGLAGAGEGVAAGTDFELRAGAFAYLPSNAAYEVRAGAEGASALVLKRRYEPYPGFTAPRALFGHRDDEPFTDTGVPGFRRRELLPPDDPAFDFNMSLLAFGPGTGLDKVEIHDEEHGLYMTAGGGTYLLEDQTHEVAAGDFIYMAPYCPQSFVAGDAGAEYLLYKDVWRDGFWPIKPRGG